MQRQGRDLTIETTGEDVRQLHTDLARLGLQVRLEELERAQFGRSTRELISRFQRERALPVTGMVDAGTVQAINEAVAAAPVDPPPVPQLASDYFVSGTVASPDRAGVAGLRVVIVDWSVGGEVELAETTTDERGRYSIGFSGESLRERGKPQPDLQARVLTEEGVLASSGVRYDAGVRETLDVVLAPAATGLLSEHEVLTGALAGHMGIPLGDLQETDDRPDLTYLANKTGWDARAVALASLAEQFGQHRTAADAGIDPAFYYALFRAGLPADPDALYRSSPHTVEQVWTQAVEKGLIPRALEEQVAAAKQTFQDLTATRALDARPLPGMSTMKELLRLELGNDDQQHEQFAKLYADSRDDPGTFWDSVRGAFGEPTAARLQLNGQLAYLTSNNAPVIARLHAAEAADPITSSTNLTLRGYYRADKWLPLVGDDVPEHIPGAGIGERRERYVAVIAAQLRLSHPTVAVAAMAGADELRLADANAVRDFLTTHQGTFELGAQPVGQFIAQRGLAVDEPLRRQLTALQRVYQITPSDGAMRGLLRRGVHSAYQVARYDEDQFVELFQADLGGVEQARLTHAKAVQVHDSVLNLAAGYLTARNAPPLGLPGHPILAMPPAAAEANGDVIAYPTLEQLLGSMDYCGCDHCRSVLSPAAYLVDLLSFLDDPTPPDGMDNPQAVLLGRRPDIQHLPLTCENTNVMVPHIDLVNETLEYFVSHEFSLDDFTGHDTDSRDVSSELLASPRNIDDTAYTTLAKALFPPPLPFHRSLEAVRRHFARFDTPLAEAMRLFRVDDRIERGDDGRYGWRDIHMEQLRISREEYRLLTDGSISLADLYGYRADAIPPDIQIELTNVRTLTRKLGITPTELVEILETRFVNPASGLLPQLARLRLRSDTIKQYRDGGLSDEQLERLLPPRLRGSDFGGGTGLRDRDAVPAVKTWLRDDRVYEQIKTLITITNPTTEGDLCAFDKLELRYLDSDAGTLPAFEFRRLLRFVRLWKKLGLSAAHTDKVITALYPATERLTGAGDAADLARLDAGFGIMLPRIGVVLTLAERLDLPLERDLLGLLACWSPLDTHGEDSLYRALFLRGTRLDEDDIFVADGLGRYLTRPDEKLLAHEPALRSALTLTEVEMRQIVEMLGFDDQTPLDLNTVSALYRWGWLARRLRMSLAELRALTKFTGLDPFAPPDPPEPPMAALVELMRALRDAALTPVQALYLMWNQDLGGNAGPAPEEFTDLARTLRADLAAVDADFRLVDDPTGQAAAERMALVYGGEATEFFFGLLNENVRTEANHHDTDPEQLRALVAASTGNTGQPRLDYDDFRKKVGYAGVLSASRRDTLQAGRSPELRAALDALFAAGQRAVDPFFERYPSLRPLFDAYADDPRPADQKRRDLLASLLPRLERVRKQQRALSAITAAASTSPDFADVLLTDPAVLALAADPTRPAVDDLVALGDAGLSATFYFRDTATGNPDLSRDEPGLAYSSDPQHSDLPANPAGGPISGIWAGYVEAAETDAVNISIETEAGATAQLAINGVDVALDADGITWRNQQAVTLTGGRLHHFSLTVQRITTVLIVRWQTATTPNEVIVSRYLYPARSVDRLRTVYLRFRKAVTLAAALRLSAADVAFLAVRPDLAVDGHGWLQGLAVVGDPPPNVVVAFGKVLLRLLDFAHLSSAHSATDDRLTAVLRDPAATGLLRALTGWDDGAVDSVLGHFGKTRPDLEQIQTFRRVHEAMVIIEAAGVPATALLAATHNDPGPADVVQLSSALRARYDHSSWLDVLRPLNDELRELQRDALVAYILNQFGQQDERRHIDTANKLFEFFLIDVQMQACMETTRIRAALSSVQLFAERCLMNLEARVSPQSIGATRWAWMKRYRVWEANRKVFLWPENWLEPELRDDQSPIFLETIGELLQGDVTADSASKALLGYLAKLDEVAKLEPCGMFHDEGSSPGLEDDVTHVVARTSGARRKYFYRRRNPSGWRAWEEIALDIEDNPVQPVVWQGRTFLFWLRILKETSTDPAQVSTGHGSTNDVGLTDLTLGQVKSDARQTAESNASVLIRAVLNWSEYFNGAWQPPVSSDVNNPLTLYSARTHILDRTQLPMWIWELRKPGALTTSLWVQVYWGYFLLHNTNSLPLVNTDHGFFAGASPFLVSDGRQLLRPDEMSLQINYYRTDGSQTERRVLSNPLPLQIVEPQHRYLDRPWLTPILVSNHRHSFYVTTMQGQVPIQRFDGFAGPVVPPVSAVAIRDLVVASEVLPEPRPVIDPLPVGRPFLVNDRLRFALENTTVVRFGGLEIGPVGRIVVEGERRMFERGGA